MAAVTPMPIPIIVLLAVFLLIAARQLVHARLRIWQIMLGGAAAVVLIGDISPTAALQAIDWDVMLFLFGMFVVGQALEESGYLAYLSYHIFSRARTLDRLLLLVLFAMGGACAFLMNDTLAIIGTPVVLLLARQHGMSPKVLLLALAFAITTGSIASPIGNPQNLLIAVHGGAENPFVEFFKFLLAPTVLSLLAVYLVLKLIYREHFHNESLIHEERPITDPALAGLCRLSLALILVLAMLKIVLAFVSPALNFRLTAIALAAAAPILAASPQRRDLLRQIDWHTLIFFAAMFVLMRSVWDSGFFQALLGATGWSITSIVMILAVGILLSQLISNVPLVALYLPMLLHAGATSKEMMALAAGSTLAGNLFILGAASNVIIIHNAEVRAGVTVTFLEFAAVGIPLTALHVLIYWGFLVLL
jgi:Na+/H+ antiporter NhaD/arsenite permease-like protein